MKPAYALLPALAVAALASCAIDVYAQECNVRAPRNASLDTAGATGVHIEARGGDLAVTGKAGGAVDVSGQACATGQDILDQIELVAERRGNQIWIEARVPEGRGDRRLDLEITIPENLPATVRDSSGDARFEGLAALDLRDSSGDVTLRNVRGDVTIEDSSGDLEIQDIGGSLTLSDSSGDIEIAGVQGEVVVERDSSGDIEASDLAKNFLVRRDGSGSIRATDIGGDFIVEQDGSGDVDFARVAGNTPTRRD